MDGPPEIVDGIVMNVMTSCSLRPASRARKPPMAWMPSCELPAMRMMASVIFATREPSGLAVLESVVSLMVGIGGLRAARGFGERNASREMGGNANRLCVAVKKVSGRRD